ncbi:hypothetical protein ACIPWY_20015 [Streptomyces sp. NPDC090032]|uniref:hypothetical protein n=1 Tax=Streptomyces sp. NPDC090032 TaxID=3365925 RepID=UPI0037F5E44C
MDADDVAEDLYRLPPAQFTAARGARAAEARRDGDAATARRIAGFRKPTLAAWVSNLLARQREEAGQLLELAQALREAHRTLDPEQFRTLSHQQHAVITGLARQAGGLARQAGQPVSVSVLHEVEQILHAVLADPEVAERWATGMLTKVPAVSTDFPGTASLAQVSARSAQANKPAAAAPASAPTSARKAPDAALEKRRARLKEAMKAATEAAAEASRREDDVRRAEEELEQATARRSAADERVALLTAQLGEAEEERRTAAATAEEASVRVRDAARERKAAQRKAERTSLAVERLSAGDTGHRA